MSKRPPTLCACGDHAFAAVTRGLVTLVDPDDAHLLAIHSYAAVPDKHTFYAITRTPGRRSSVSLHRQIMQIKSRVDHRNGDGLDNRRRNLREATPVENARNRNYQPAGPSGHVGVRIRKGRYESSITVNGKKLYLGRFEKLDDAVAARIAAVAKHFGDFAANNQRTTKRTVHGTKT